MADFLSLHDAIATHVKDGDTVAMEGFTHLIPFAAGHEVIRQKRTGLTLIQRTDHVFVSPVVMRYLDTSEIPAARAVFVRLREGSLRVLAVMTLN